MLILTPLATAAEPSQEPVVLGVQVAHEGEYTYFVVDVARPEEMAAMSIEDRPLRFPQRAWPRVAELRGKTPWGCPIYLEYESPTREWGFAARLDRLTFVGRCPGTPDALPLVLRYPLLDGNLRESGLTLKLAGAAPGAPPIPQRWAKAQAAWFGVLHSYTGDPGGFYTFAAQQTRRQFDLPAEAVATQPAWPQPPPEEQLYDIATGALAVQESLQLDRMTNTDRDKGAREIVMKDIPAVGVMSHPFDKMRAGKEPVYSALARLTPQDFYYLRFASLAKLYDLLDFADQWGPSLLQLASAVGTDYGVRERMHRQLCLPETVLSRVLGPAVIHELAIVGSDPYLREGSDVTVLFRVSVRPAFQLAVDQYIQQALQEFPAATHDTVTYEGVAIERLVEPARRVSCHRCWLGDVCVYGNSLAAVKRIIDTHASRQPSLADAPDFQYMRAAVYPLDPATEDGFLYLSDAFIRHLVGPALRIKEKRRLEVITSLKMISNAALLHGYEFGPGQPTLEKLTAAGCLAPADLFDPDQGSFEWDSQQGAARNTTYGGLSFLTPLIEIDSDRATALEREQYGRFRDRYQQYWRRYFDPIGVRIKVDRTIRLEPYILPLIDLSAYDELEDFAKGPPVEVRLDRFTPSTLFRVMVRLNDGTMKSQALTFLRMAGGGTNAATDWVGDWGTFWIEDTAAFQTMLQRQSRAEDGLAHSGDEDVIDIFNASFVVGIHVKNKLSLAGFLLALRSFIQTTAPNTVVFNDLPPYKDLTIVQMAPDPRGELARELHLGTAESNPAGADQAATTAPASRPAVSERGPALYYAAIGDGFYIATQASALRHLIDTLSQDAATRPAPMSSNVLVYAAPGAAELLRPTVSYWLEQQARDASLHNLTQVWLLGRCGVLENRPLDDAARTYLGYRLVCPDGGAYSFDPVRLDAVSAIHGPLSQPRRLDTLPEGSPLQSLLSAVRTVVVNLRFTDDGIATTVEIARH